MAEKRKRKKPRGKAKGGANERKGAETIIKHFRKLGFTKRDCYRTERGCAVGDLYFSSALEKIFRFTLEAKHYKKFNMYQLFYRYEKMKKSWLFKQWWEQLLAEIVISKKPGLLVFRQNNALELCAFRAGSLSDRMLKVYQNVSKFEIKKKDGVLWVMPFEKFLRLWVRNCKS